MHSGIKTQQVLLWTKWHSFALHLTFLVHFLLFILSRRGMFTYVIWRRRKKSIQYGEIHVYMNKVTFAFCIFHFVVVLCVFLLPQVAIMFVCLFESLFCSFFVVCVLTFFFKSATNFQTAWLKRHSGTVLRNQDSKLSSR